MFDVIIIGAGPAGLSAALVLGRCCRRVLVCDNHKHRNASSKALHGYLALDNIPPLEFLKTCHKQISAYKNVQFKDGEVTDIRKMKNKFEVLFDSGDRYQAKKVLLATGLIDDIPNLEGIEDFYGRSVFHCPYCDGWELRGKPLAVYGKGKRGLKLSLTLKCWSDDVVLLTDGPAKLTSEDIKKLTHNGMKVYKDSISKLEGENGILQRIVFVNGIAIKRRALFFNTPSCQRSPLAMKLGCDFTRKNAIKTGKYEVTSIPGLYAAGNVLRDVQMVVVAAAEGAKAAFGINTALHKESLK